MDRGAAYCYRALRPAQKKRIIDDDILRPGNVKQGGNRARREMEKRCKSFARRGFPFGDVAPCRR